MQSSVVKNVQKDDEVLLAPFFVSFSFIIYNVSSFVIFQNYFNIFQNQKNVKLQRNGAELALRNIARHFQEKLPEKIPELWNVMIGTLERNLQNVSGK